MADKRTRAEIERENAELNSALDAIEDVLADDELTATRKVAAAQEELDRFQPEEEEETGDE